uniref:NADH dehydrogenase subunit 6 n=1 Tax=Mansonella ozzardi TaxID=122354 RepID=UPI00286CB52C|nr:NADH dehydrogenase subunit 6 [Mansonella ozzardi]WLE64572.1 NADH dehydrogenase subunit 6 [Mansonella ozzardi]WLV27608.1 NADH dehydrogenase subunit 6 [Mansonella ozzardi]WLW41718.1 NADH dehydrogenase subunit 6 [Mansonella ozzardi]WLW41742.1 NADH dehydrogenase subunit 6 [Mansonella ozzardi]WLW41754.1 NADH dehydrogenase subunit 6 [Mansonella ozzardi]
MSFYCFSFFYVLMYCSFFFSVLMFCFSCLEWNPLKSCVSLCLGILFMSCYISLGLHVWYSYFIILIFLSGVFSLLTYFCSMSNFSYYENYFYIFVMFFVVLLFFLFFFDYDFFSHYLDFNFLCVYYDFNYYYIFWVISLLLLFLNLISYNLGDKCYMRGL